MDALPPTSARVTGPTGAAAALSPTDRTQDPAKVAPSAEGYEGRTGTFSGRLAPPASRPTFGLAVAQAFAKPAANDWAGWKSLVERSLRTSVPKERVDAASVPDEIRATEQLVRHPHRSAEQQGLLESRLAYQGRPRLVDAGPGYQTGLEVSYFVDPAASRAYERQLYTTHADRQAPREQVEWLRFPLQP